MKDGPMAEKRGGPRRPAAGSRDAYIPDALSFCLPLFLPFFFSLSLYSGEFNMRYRAERKSEIRSGAARATLGAPGNPGREGRNRRRRRRRRLHPSEESSSISGKKNGSIRLRVPHIRKSEFSRVPRNTRVKERKREKKQEKCTGRQMANK